MRVFLGIAGFVIFVGALSLAYWLLQQSKLSGAEFVAFVIAFAVIGAIVSFGPEVQEFTIAGNAVKLREVKNNALKLIDTLKATQAELLRLSLRARPLINGGFSFDRDHLSIDPDFWAIVAEAKRTEAIEALTPDLLNNINLMIRALYELTISWGMIQRPGDQTCESMIELAADLMSPDLLKLASRDRGDADESTYKNFVMGRLKEIEKLFALKRELTKT
jgi:hypothetical protein